MGKFTRFSSEEITRKPKKVKPEAQPIAVVEIPEGYEQVVCYSNECEEPVIWMVRYGEKKDDFSFTCSRHAKYLRGSTYIRMEYMQQYVEDNLFNMMMYTIDWTRNNAKGQTSTAPPLSVKATPKFASQPIILKGSLSW